MSISMASYNNKGMSEDMPKVRFDVPLFNTRLIFIRNNKSRAQIYVDPSNQFVVKLENMPIDEPFV